MAAYLHGVYEVSG